MTYAAIYFCMAYTLYNKQLFCITSVYPFFHHLLSAPIHRFGAYFIHFLCCSSLNSIPIDPCSILLPFEYYYYADFWTLHRCILTQTSVAPLYIIAKPPVLLQEVRRLSDWAAAELLP